jgi:hypothetical protein
MLQRIKVDRDADGVSLDAGVGVGEGSRRGHGTAAKRHVSAVVCLQ